MLGGMIVIQTGWRKKRPAVVFRTSAWLVCTLRRFARSFPSCALLSSFLRAPFRSIHNPAVDSLFLPSTGNLSPKKNNTERANGIIVIHAGRIIGSRECLRMRPEARLSGISRMISELKTNKKSVHNRGDGRDRAALSCVFLSFS